jgi:hypothetical protein
MIVVLFLLSLIGIAILSVALSIVITHFILRAIEVLLPVRYPMCHETTKTNKYQTANDDKHPRNEEVLAYPLNIRRCDLYEIIRSRINKMLHDPTTNECPNQKCTANAKQHYRYINRYPPHIAQPPLPSPIEHIRTIVNKLRRAVNQSGKEPFYRYSSVEVDKRSSPLVGLDKFFMVCYT